MGTEFAEQAIWLIDAQPIDVVLLDLNLPGGNGLDVLRRVKLQHPSIEVIVTTADGAVQTAVCFVALAGYVSYESLSDLARHKAPEHSIPGIVLACVSLVVMPILSRAKKKVGQELGSKAMHADARQTDFCVYLSGILLVGLGLNATMGLWWADASAALIMVPLIAKEGIQAMRGDTCCN